jgi:NADH dehydrogenase
MPKAVAQVGPIHGLGLMAWTLWCIVHVFFLIGLRNQTRVMSEWTGYYLTFKPGARLLTEQPTRPGKNSSKISAHESATADRTDSRRAA